MQSHERQLLQSNIEPLARAINNFADVSKLLLIRNTFNQDMLNHIQEYSSDAFFRNVVLISDLQTRGPTAFEEFIETLELVGCIEALRIISPDSLTMAYINPDSKLNSSYNKVKSNVSPSEEATSYPLGMFSYSFPVKHNAGSLLDTDSNVDIDPVVAGEGNEVDHEYNNGENKELNNQQNELMQQDMKKFLFYWHPYPTITTSRPSQTASTRAVGNNINNQPLSHQLDNHEEEIDKKTTNNYNNMTVKSSNAPNAMTIKQAIVCHNDEIEDYKMTSKPRGICIIINIMDFDDNISAQRRGSDIDAKRFAENFTDLWFEVHLEQNLSARDMKRSLIRIASMCREDHNALVVIIMSHGDSSGILGSDGLQLDPDDIFNCFDNERCKIMKGKPKVFIIQACRGTLKDFGELGDEEDLIEDDPNEDMIYSIGDRPPLFARSVEFSRNGGTYALRTDMLVCFSCLPGYVSVRSEISGSWLGTALSFHLMQWAFEKDLEQILTMVSKDIEGKVSSFGHKQAVEIKYLGWRKKLYFNPGIIIYD